MSKESKFVSKVTKNNCLDSQLYAFISDFRNIAAMIPAEYRDKVSCTQHAITMEVMKGMNFTLSIVEEEPYKLIKLGAEGTRDFSIWIQLKQVAPYDTRIRITLEAEIPMVAKMFAKNKLQVFVDSFAEALSQIPVYAFQGNNLN
jgi:carbon monoxide dehydrogenase subunit G